MKNVFFEITLRSLKSNKVRATATLIGVALSVAMISAVLFFSASIFSFIAEETKADYGDWGTAIENMDRKVGKLVENEQIEYGVMNGVAYSYIGTNLNQKKQFLYLVSMDQKMTDMTNLEIVEGRLPANDREITIPQHLLTTGGIKYEIGDTITIPMGYRVNTRTGEELGQYDTYNSSVEVYISDVEKEFEVVGICKRLSAEPYMAPGYTAVVYPQKEYTDQHFTYFYSKDYGRIENIIDQYYFPEDRIVKNTALLQTLGFIRGDRQGSILVMLAITLITFVIIGGCMLMYNTFNFSLRERRKYYQILASVGATENQLRKASIYEGIFIAGIGIPIGIIAGIVGTWAGILIFGRSLASVFSSDYNSSVVYNVTYDWVLAAIVISLIMVQLSIIIPAYKTGKTRPIENFDYEFVSQRTQKSLNRSNRIAMKMFGIEGLLASKNFRKNRSMYKYTIISLTMSIVLFLCASSGSMYVGNTVKNVAGTESGYEVVYEGESYYEAQSAFNILSTSEGVEKGSLIAVAGYVSKENILKNEVGEKEEYGLYIVDNSTFEACLDQNNISSDGYFSEKTPKALVMIQKSIGDYKKVRSLFEDNLDEIDGTIGKADVKIKIGEIIDTVQWNILPELGRPVLIISESAAGSVINNAGAENFRANAYFTSSESYYAIKSMKAMCEDNGLAEDNLRNLDAEREELQSIMMVVKVLSYGFILLISLVALVNVFNTISSSMDMRRYEFATLLSVGMSMASLKKMIYYECIILGLKTVVYAFPLTLLGLYIVFNNQIVSSITGYVLPIANIGLSVLILFGTVFSIMIYSAYKTRQEDIAKVLKTRNF